MQSAAVEGRGGGRLANHEPSEPYTGLMPGAYVFYMPGSQVLMHGCPTARARARVAESRRYVLSTAVRSVVLARDRGRRGGPRESELVTVAPLRAPR
ncbi:hypothetical protein ON010_g18969 [Phytophthora cinnamomi]|nr:hypothetical protein ON010_g18969 [Phytophthora cinnamomi]